MVIAGGANISPAAPVARTYQPQTFAPAPAAKEKEETADLSRRFDSVTISENGTGSLENDLKSRLTQEARTVTSTERIASLRDQIRSGEYRPDPMAIARKMLLLGEAM